MKNKYQQQISVLKNKINSLNSTLSCINVNLRQVESKQNAMSKDVCLTLLPIIKCYERKNDKFIMPNGQRIRLSKIDFRFCEKIKRADSQWNGISFKFEPNTNIIYYSFEIMYSRENGKSARQITEEHFNFKTYFLKSKLSESIETLKTKTNEEIESFLIYGVRPSKEKERLEIVKKDILNEISIYSHLKQRIEKVYSYEKIKHSIDTAFDENYQLKSITDVENARKRFDQLAALYS